MVTVVLVIQNTSTLRSNLTQESKSFATLATKPIGDAFILYKDSGSIRIQQQIDKLLDLNPNISAVQILDTSGKVQFDSLKRSSTDISAEQAATFKPIYLYENGNIVRIIQPLQEDFGARRYTIIYDVSSTQLQENIKKVVIVIITFSITALFLSIILSYLLINFFFLRPLREVSSSALKISHGSLEQQIKLNRDDEIGDLAHAVNEMADSLKSNIVKLQEVDKLKSEFMMITSHNLRTPISIIRGYLEMANDMTITKEIKDIFQAISANTVRLGTFTEDVLAIATIESGQMMIHPEVMPFKPIVDDLAEQFKTLAVQKKLNVIVNNTLTNEQAALSHSHIKGALWNLLDNAYKFTPEKGTVSIEAKTANDNLQIFIKDTGIGIAKSEMPKLFTKFHRATSTMTYDYEGTGIGLYLTKLIIERHNGTINVESEEGKGSTFVITIKQAKEPLK